MKRIAVVATEKRYAKYLRDNLAMYFEKHADIRYYSLREVARMNFIEEEYVAVSTFNIFQSVKKKLKNSSELIVFSLTLTKDNIKHLEEIPQNTRALLVNFDYQNCMQVITNIYSLGYRDLELVPYCGGEYDTSIKLAITPDEAHLAPRNIEKIINIGQRDIDLNCVIEIADQLGLEGILRNSKAFAERKNLFFSNSSMEKVLGENESLGGRANALIKLMEQGMIITDVVGTIHLCNEKAERLLKSRTEFLVGFNISELLPEIKVVGFEIQEEGAKKELISINGQNIITSVTQIMNGREISGNIITLDNFEEIEEKQHGMRAKLSQTSHVARYYFSDIKGNSESIAATIITAKRMAKSDSSILITGESGTGKEVFAQSIHNESSRRKYNFVAVNCAAIPENLLESEMFGYEEGSFSGAKKGGKIGYFEMAHKGSIFLDEIAEMPLLLQSKLLRVIEERKIIKIGSQKVIDVDVRIIAATNKDLYRKVCEGTFREDLYYRLNVLPLQIPCLRERKGDVMILVQHFMDKLNCRLNFSIEAQKSLEQYRWRGNIRELRNVMEYLASMEKQTIQKEDLPFTNQDQGKTYYENQNDLTTINANAQEVQPKLAHNFLLKEGSRIELFRFVLENLYQALKNKQRLGRAGLQSIAERESLMFTETEIRTALNKLNAYGFIKSGKGRGGSVITQDGIQLINEIKGLFG